MNNGIIELAKLFKERENQREYTPVFGKIVSLPNLKISIYNNKIELSENQVKSTFDIKKQIDDEYIYINRTVVLLPYNKHQNYIAIGVINND